MPADFADRTDFDNAERGLVARLEPGVIKAADGRVVFDIDEFGRVLQGEPPDTVNPSLWRQGQLTAIQGLFEVTGGIYQARGLDLSNMTLVESDHGVIVIDPLVSAECAAAALALYRAQRGDKPVTAVIYTHAHIDHFGGVLGVVEAGTTVPIIAPEHFMQHAVSENVYAGIAMLRRGMYYSGEALPTSAAGRVGMGLGAKASTGAVGLLAPTLDITRTGQEEVIDGVRIVFQLTPGTESPAEMNFFFPGARALCLAENATHNLHNLLTLRGAQVRDARIWSRYLSEAMELFGENTDVAFASHHWPTWGAGNIRTYLSEQRDLYAYLHDQTLRLMNQGYTGAEIAELIEVPPKLDAAWHTHGYYGSVSHNVKAIYQRYLGWYDGNPAHLWQHPPEAAARRYARLAGGADQLAARARVSRRRRPAVRGGTGQPCRVRRPRLHRRPGRAGPGPAAARLRRRVRHLAELFPDGRQGTARRDPGHGGQCERHGPGDDRDPVVRHGRHPDRRPRAADARLSIRWDFTDSGERYLMELSNGVLIHYPTTRAPDADLTLTLTHAQLLGLLASGSLDGITTTGDPSVPKTLLSLTDEPDPNFAVVTP